MKQGFRAVNHLSPEGFPAGGLVDGNGLTIRWQNGPLREQGNDPTEGPNGAFVEDVIEAVLQRMQHYQELPFACPENEVAIHHLRCALGALNERTARREAAGVEGTHGLRDVERGA